MTIRDLEGLVNDDKFKNGGLDEDFFVLSGLLFVKQILKT